MDQKIEKKINVTYIIPQDQNAKLEEKIINELTVFFANKIRKNRIKEEVQSSNIINEGNSE